MDQHSKIYIAGHRGLVGSAISRKLKELGYRNLLTRTHRQLDLTDSRKVADFFDRERPDYVFLAAAKVGGIYANTKFPAELLHTNLSIQTSVIHSAAVAKVKRLIFVGSSCIYPEQCNRPMKEDDVFSGSLEPGTQATAIPKIAGIKMCELYNQQYGTRFFSVIPPTLYGPNDNFNPDSSHVLSALLAKFHHAKEYKRESVAIWGTGTPRREFLHVNDFADACTYLMNLDNTIFDSQIASLKWVVNVGYGDDMQIRDLALIIKQIVGYLGSVKTDPSHPDGAPQKLLDSTMIGNLGWSPKILFADGLKGTYTWYKSRQSKTTDQPP